MPEDVVEDLKAMAPELGFAGYQPLIRAYISEGMRRDEQKLYFSSAKRMAEVLKARGVDPVLVEQALLKVPISAQHYTRGQRFRTSNGLTGTWGIGEWTPIPINP